MDATRAFSNNATRRMSFQRIMPTVLQRLDSPAISTKRNHTTLSYSMLMDNSIDITDRDFVEFR